MSGQRLPPLVRIPGAARDAGQDPGPDLSGDSGRIAVKVELRLVLMVRSRRFICERVWTGLFFSRAEAKTPTEQLDYYIISMTIAALRSS